MPSNDTIPKLIPIIFLVISCKKLVEIPAPVNFITTTQVFATDDQASSAVSGMYAYMINSQLTWSSGIANITAGLSADEFTPFDQSPLNAYLPFYNNNLTNINGVVGTLWSIPYKSIYQANAIIEGLTSSTAVHDSIRTELMAETKCIRAFCYLYLTNIFGDLPLVTSTNWQKTGLFPRSSTQKIYDLILSDLTEAENALPQDYSLSGGLRIRCNKWTAKALLARYYLYTGDWVNSEAKSTEVIAMNSLYQLEDSLKDVFLTTSKEAIWQLAQNNSSAPFNATPEGNSVIPFNNTSHPLIFLSNSLLGAFEDSDRRKKVWIDSTVYRGTTYYYPFKYIEGPSAEKVNATIKQYYMVLRLAEQYLIRAEARAHQNKFDQAAADINTIRIRAGLDSILFSNMTDAQTAILQERRIELFAEWGHRWLDLKRTNQATAVLQPLKSAWTADDVLYPIPQSELLSDPNLTQNSGY